VEAGTDDDPGAAVAANRSPPPFVLAGLSVGVEDGEAEVAGVLLEIAETSPDLSVGAEAGTDEDAGAVIAAN